MKNLIESIIDHAIATPNAIAIETNKIKINYRDLMSKVEKLSRYLQEYYELTYNQRLTSFDSIPVFFEKSIDYVIGVLAVLHAGANFVPLSIQLPAQRLHQILEALDIRVVLTGIQFRHNIEKITRYNDRQPLFIDIDDELAYEQYDVMFAVDKILSSSLVYIIFTSGTSGKPKGVKISHQALQNLYVNQLKILSLSTDAKVLAFADISFDASIWEIFSSLIAGATLFIPQQNEILPGISLEETLISNNITHATIPPSVQYQMRDTPFPSLRVLVSAGEPCSNELIEKWKLQKFTYINAYGPTEATVCASFCNVGETLTPALGNPIYGMKWYLVDIDSGKLITQPGKGELWLSGASLMEGYVGEEPRASLINNPFNNSQDPTYRYCYKTGDFVERLTDGHIQFLGRVDRQVKVRGYRIELIEIENCLRNYPNILNVAVLTVESKIDHLHEIIAFYTSHNGEELQNSELRNHCLKILPDYMLPQNYICCDELPLTVNKKIDYEKLKALYINSDCTDQVRPMHSINPKVEEAIIETISELLNQNKKQIQLTDNFFQLGGHSLLMTKIIVMLKNKLGVTLTINEFINCNTLLDLKHVIDQKMEIETETNVQTEQKNLIITNPEKYHKPFPLSDIQQAYFIGRQDGFEVGGVSTNVYREFSFKSIDIDALQVALNKLIKRHEMLRAIIVDYSMQKILSDVGEYKISIHNMVDQYNETMLQQHLFNIRERLSHGVLPANKWPLFAVEATVLPSKIIIHVVIDALIADAFSVKLFFNEWSYFIANPDGKLPDINLSFCDYAWYIHNLASTSDQYQIDKNYWQEKVKTLPPAPLLPRIFTNNEGRPMFTSCVRKTIEEKIFSKLKTLAASINSTTSCLLLTLFCDVLNQWSEICQFTVNITLFNRIPVHPDVDKLIGDFTTIDLFAADFYENEASFSERVNIVQKKLHKDLDYQLYSGVQVQRDYIKQSHLKKTGALMPIVFTCVIEDIKDELIDENIFTFSNMTFGSTQASQVWLDFKAYSESGELIIEWDYVPEVLPNELIEAMHNEYCKILCNLSHDLYLWERKNFFDKSISTLLNKSDDTQLYLDSTCLQSGFLKHYHHHPSRVAAIFQEKQYTYEELYKRAIGLSGKIQALNIRPRSIIAIIMPRCIDQIIAVLGVLFADCVYLPVDSQQPYERLQAIINDLEVKAIVTTSSLEDMLRTLQSPHVSLSKHLISNVMEDTGDIKNLEPKISSPDDLAYVICTSGSTGAPKAVSISHSSAMNTIDDMNYKFSIDNSSVVLTLSYLHFDLSVYDIFGTFAVGGKLIVISDEQYHDPSSWYHLMLEHGVTLWNSVPQLWQLWIDHCNKNKNILPAIAHHLTNVWLSGDWVSPKLAYDSYRLLLDFNSNFEVTSLGGATEASIWSIYYRIPRDINNNIEYIPYGKALTNQSMLVLHQNLLPAPVGVAGEIYIGGKGLAISYINDEVKTSQKFITHPETGLRLYKTGDLGCLLPDGNIKFLGRLDNQVKLNGYRVDLGEIESIILKLSFVKWVAVRLVTLNNNSFLVAFIKSDNHDLIEKNSIMSFVAKYLPSYMIPNYYTKIENIPLTDNGKLCQKSLMKLFEKQATDSTIQKKPSTDLERELASIWRAVIDDAIPVFTTSDFILLGGNSLGLIKLISLLKEKYGIHFTIKQLIDNIIFCDMINLIQTSLVKEKI